MFHAYCVCTYLRCYLLIAITFLWNQIIHSFGRKSSDRIWTDWNILHILLGIFSKADSTTYNLCSAWSYIPYRVTLQQAFLLHSFHYILSNSISFLLTAGLHTFILLYPTKWLIGNLTPLAIGRAFIILYWGYLPYFDSTACMCREKVIPCPSDMHINHHSSGMNPLLSSLSAPVMTIGISLVLDESAISHLQPKGDVDSESRGYWISSLRSPFGNPLPPLFEIGAGARCWNVWIPILGNCQYCRLTSRLVRWTSSCH